MTITVATLKDATAQQVYNQVREHLLAQGQKSATSMGCRYRTGSLSCAAGCLIGVDEYSRAMEGNNWNTLVEEGQVHSEHAELIRDLQRIHDGVRACEWAEHLAYVAVDHGLQA